MRYPLDDAAAAALQAAVDVALTRTGRIVTEERSDVLSEPARGAFTRNQMFATLFVYGPAFAAIVETPELYLLAAGASYFITNRIAGKEQVTRAQNHLTSDAAWRGFAVGTGALYAIAGDAPDGKTVALVGLASGLTTAVAGFRAGRGFSDAEAESRTTVSTLSAATTFLVLETFGLLGEDVAPRATIGAIVGAAGAGYLIGPRYARQPGFGVTKGDVELLKLSAQLGVMLATTPLVETNTGEEAVSGAALAGLVGGALFGHSRLVRRYDHTSGEAGQVKLGVLAGGALGLGTSFLLSLESETRSTMALTTGGAVLGAIAGHRIARPARAGSPRAGTAPDERGGPSVEFLAQDLALALAGVPGRHVGLRLRF